MIKVVFWVSMVIAVTPFVIGALLTWTLCFIPFSIRSKSIKGGFKDCIELFNDFKGIME